MSSIDIIEKLENDLEKANEKISDLIQRLQKYTNSDGHKKYYEKNKERVKLNGSKYLKKLKEDNPEKIKEYAHRSYMKRKLKQLIIEKESIENKN